MNSRLFGSFLLGMAICTCFGSISFGQSSLPGAHHEICPKDSQAVRARIDCEMMRAMNLANQGRMSDAVVLAESVWNETHDPAVGFSLVQLLEHSAVNESVTCSILPRQCAANIARELILKDNLPNSLQRQLPAAIYRHSVALAVAGESDRALEVLAESFRAGFAGFDIAVNEPALQQTCSPEKLRSLVETARAKAVEHLIEESRRELAAFSSFPFAIDSVDVEAREFSLQSLQGKVVIVDFWGTWCPLCRRQTGSLVQLQKEFPNDLAVVGLAFENGDVEFATATVRESMLDHGINYPCLLGDPSIQNSIPGFAGFPTSVFLDRSGKVRLVISGENSLEKYRSIVKLLLGEE